MQKMSFWAAAAAIFAFTAPAAMADSNAVKFDMTSDMESLNDPSQNDVFNIALADGQVVTKIAITCNAGSSKFFGLQRTDEACAVAGNGSLVNPKDPTKQLPRVLYSGDYDVNPSGLTQAKTPPGLLSGTRRSVGFGRHVRRRPEAEASGPGAQCRGHRPKLSQEDRRRRPKRQRDRQPHRYGTARPVLHSVGRPSVRPGNLLDRRHGLRLSDVFVAHQGHGNLRGQGLHADRQHALDRC